MVGKVSKCENVMVGEGIVRDYVMMGSTRQCDYVRVGTVITFSNCIKKPICFHLWLLLQRQSEELNLYSTNKHR